MLLAELLAAFRLLTRLPLGARAPVPMERTVWAFPVVGAAVGALGGLAYGACSRAGLPSPVGAVWTLVAMLLTTGAFHEDGLADLADGLGGGRTRARKLEIMRDSRIGSFGALALMLSLAARGAAIAAIGEPAAVAAALVAAAALGRAGILILVLALDPARPDGLAAGLRRRAPARLAAGLVIALAAAFILLPPNAAASAVAGMVLTAIILAWIVRRQIGGYTGDALGATAVLGECVALGLIGR